ncbi:MAG TPA: DsbA family protein [Longimicrobiales bacterium]|nr:DsbA family protein [Longimicrobiales bacterium]
MEVLVVERGLIVFADYVCPYCRLAEAAVEQLRGNGIAVEAAAFELRPAGTPALSPDEPWMRAAWEQHVGPLASRLGVTMRMPPLVPRTAKAHEAAAFARSQGALRDMHAAVYAAYWEDGRDIGRIDVLTEIAEEVGLEPGAMRVALDIDQFTDRVAADRAVAARLGLSGVPAFVRTGSDGDLRTGLQTYDELKAWVTQNDV